jgi:hypothetical protein
VSRVETWTVAKRSSLVYQSQRETVTRGAFCVRSRNVGRIDPEDTFGAGYGLAPPKPKGMHWRTYDRLVAEMQRAASAVARRL